MDFFGILFDMKNGKKIPYSKNYFDTLFAENLAGVTTLTGTLPLTFTTSETALRSWTIYGADIEHIETASGKSITFHTDEDKLRDWTIYGNADGVGERTKNLLKITTGAFTDHGVTFTFDAETGIVVANGKATGGQGRYAFYIEPTETLNLYLSGCPEGGSTSTYNIYPWDSTTNARPKKWDGTTSQTGSDYGTGGLEVQAAAGHNLSATIRIEEGYTANNLVFKPMYRLSDTSADFIPYGYEVPLTISQTGQTDKNYEIFIGDSPLAEGETVSKTSTGVDIATADGNNTITTTLYNQPDMSITYNEFTGVGEPVNDSWQIPLAVTCDRNLFNIYGNMTYSGGVHLIDYNVDTSSVTGEMSANSFFQLGVQNAIIKGDETFVISFDKTTAGMAELRMMNGTGSSAEIIETFDISAAKSYRIVFECEESFGNVYPRLFATEAATNTFEHIMIKKASDKGGFVPYGAKYEYNVPIEAPLTEGQSVTDTLTINTFEGENTVDTTLENKPQMSITYKGG